MVSVLHLLVLVYYVQKRKLLSRVFYACALAVSALNAAPLNLKIAG